MDSSNYSLGGWRGVKVYSAENPEPKHTRAAKPSNQNWRHLDFLEEKAQWAFDSQENDEAHVQWLEDNSDFAFCEKHEELVEMIKLHPDQKYNPECGMCLKKQKNEENGVPLTAFFTGHHMNIKSLQEAESNWNVLSRERDRINKENQIALSNRQINAKEAKAASNACSIAERSAFLWYYYLAWVETQHRVEAIKENAAAPGQSSKFNMLPSVAHDDLVKFNHNCQLRGNKTAAGRSGKPAKNRRPCSVHQGQTGHMIHGYNKDRYLGCGVCIKPRDLSLTQKMLNDLGSSAQHPPVQFGVPKEVPKAKFKVLSATARLTAPVQRMQSLSLESEAEMN